MGVLDTQEWWEYHNKIAPCGMIKVFLIELNTQYTRVIGLLK